MTLSEEGKVSFCQAGALPGGVQARGIGPPDRWENMKTLQKQLIISFEYKGIGKTSRYAVEYEKGLRLGKISDNKSRPIAIFFTNRWKRDGALNEKKPKRQGCVMFEMLIRSKLNLLVNARKKLGTRNCWSWKGQIFTSENENIKKIESELDF
ncbi:hypothetical protein JTB14_003176 [Gonioctena quinquepunctata]|nr:hypothetical protein JTB14_003176 [Gonioctena quinquepunctata]